MTALRAAVAQADDEHDCALTQSQARQRAALAADDAVLALRPDSGLFAPVGG